MTTPIAARRLWAPRKKWSRDPGEGDVPELRPLREQLHPAPSSRVARWLRCGGGHRRAGGESRTSESRRRAECEPGLGRLGSAASRRPRRERGAVAPTRSGYRRYDRMALAFGSSNPELVEGASRGAVSTAEPTTPRGMSDGKVGFVPETSRGNETYSQLRGGRSCLPGTSSLVPNDLTRAGARPLQPPGGPSASRRQLAASPGSQNRSSTAIRPPSAWRGLGILCSRHPLLSHTRARAR